jgi:hypothetical protein
VSGALTLRFTRVSPTRHRFEFRREDGTGEAVEVETRSFLARDLLRYVVESEAQLRGSFYGILGRIGGYEELAVAGGAALGGEIATAEPIVGALMVALQDDDLGEEAFVAQISEQLDVYEQSAPRWVTPAFIATVRERMRRLLGRWNGTAVGETMELEFPAPLAGGGAGG